ncbi:ADP-ribosylation factor 6 [Schistosoma japonicum]|nr:ADP-ribosylation factor 6 [Schistosoma japonicum]
MYLVSLLSSLRNILQYLKSFRLKCHSFLYGIFLILSNIVPSIFVKLVRSLTFRMGKLFSKLFGNKEMRILMLGLDAAGKTTMKPNEIQERLMLAKLSQGRLWYVQPSIATTGEGLYEGLTWLNANHSFR